MDMSAPAPMVNADLMQRHAGRRVRTVIKVLRQPGDGTVQGQAPDGAQITIRSSSGLAYPSSYAEIIGLVEGDNVLREEAVTSFGDSFDMASYNQLCILANGKHQALFV
eukprot:SM000106S13997  [mRNA]  locus=s106:320265:320871:- [translate_table: standard]